MANIKKRITRGSASLQEAQQQMCEIGRRLWARGLCAGNDGNLSCRLGADRVLCTPTGVSKGFMAAGDLCVLDRTGRQLAGARQRTSEVLLHLAIYRERPDIGAVVHAHAPHATAFALAGMDLPTGIYPEAEVLLGVVKVAPYATPGTARVAESIVPLVRDASALLLSNHGAVTFAADLEQAHFLMEMLDNYARIALLLNQLGRVRRLTPAQMRELLLLKRSAGIRDPRIR